MTSEIKKIEIFSRIDDSRIEKVRALFSSRQHERGVTILQYNEPVDGLYVLEQGEVAVTIPDFEGVLATLGEGSSFGELSLFNVDNLASATVSVSTDTADLSFCPREALVQALEDDELLAAGFYHGSSLLVAERLRTTNQKIGGEIANSMKMAKSLIEEISTSGALGFAQRDILNAGSHIVTGMTDILKALLLWKDLGEPVPHDQISRLADSAKEIYYSEFQIFERVHDELQILGQHLDNVNRLLSQQQTLEIEGDLPLVDMS